MSNAWAGKRSLRGRRGIALRLTGDGGRGGGRSGDGGERGVLGHRRYFEVVFVVIVWWLSSSSWTAMLGDAAVVRQVGISSACEDMCSRHSHVTVIPAGGTGRFSSFSNSLI